MVPLVKRKGIKANIQINIQIDSSLTEISNNLFNQTAWCVCVCVCVRYKGDWDWYLSDRITYTKGNR